MGTTTNYGWTYPTVNADADTWGTILNTMAIAIDASLKTVDTATSAAALKANNLSDLADKPTARTNLGLGTAAVANVSDAGSPLAAAFGSVVSGNVPIWGGTTGTITDSGVPMAGLCKTASNLSDLANAGNARVNLGLGTMATRNYSSGTAAPSGGSNGDLYGQYA